jgi:hypothetical protein
MQPRPDSAYWKALQVLRKVGGKEREGDVLLDVGEDEDGEMMVNYGWRGPSNTLRVV